MRRILAVGCISIISACSSFVSDNVLHGDLSVNDESVTDEILCLSAFNSEVKIPKSKIQQNILNEVSRRKITPEQCSSYAVSSAGGVDSFCGDFNRGYVNGDAARMTSFGNYITLQDMLSVQKTLGIDCNTKRYVDEHNEARAVSASTPPVDFSRSWEMFKPKTNTVNCTSFGGSTMCNDTNGNSLNIHRW